jgi:hypothetical protein
VSPRAGPAVAGRAGRGGGDVATLVREDRHRLLGSLPLQRARNCASGNGGSSSDLWGAHPPAYLGFPFWRETTPGRKVCATHYGTAGAARTPVGQRSPVSSRFSFFCTILQARRKSKICAGKKKRALKNQNKNEGSSSAIAAKIVRVMLAALKIGWAVEFGANFLFMDVDAIPFGKNFIKILQEVRRTARGNRTRLARHA